MPAKKYFEACFSVRSFDAARSARTLTDTRSAGGNAALISESISASSGRKRSRICGIVSSSLNSTAAAPTVPCAAKVAEAAETAAVVAVLPEANVTAKAEPSVGKINAVGESDAAKVEPNIGKIDAVGESDAAKANQPVVLTEAETTKQSEPGWIGEVREADEGEDCSLVGMYSRCRLLSGPWSVKRRLEAARIRGDTEEEERLTELLEEVVCEALKAEEDD